VVYMRNMRKNTVSTTHGWSKEKPSTHERTLMLRLCGKKCFLGTKKSFPICKKNTCTISKRGIHAAYIRSRQFRTRGQKYRTISKKARRLLKRK
jgi:hypothetical protein